MSTQFTHKNLPNPAKLIESLRHLGYDNYTAITDLVDNAWDAGAKNVRISVRVRDGEHEIIIADDGAGMDDQILDQAIKLGSLVQKDPATDLGKYGMGLVTASLSIARQTTVLTKAMEGKLLKAVNDVDEIVRTNEFVSFLGKPDIGDEALFQNATGKSVSGSVILLRKCDNLQSKSNTTQFANTLAKHLGRVFRYFLISDRTLYINDEKVTRFDPLKWEDPQTEHFCDEKFEVKFSDGENTLRDTVHIKLAILPDNSGEGEKAKDHNTRTQGFYVMRNNREIMDAKSLNLFTKHPDFNRFRGEILFSGILDKHMGVNFTKNGVRLGQSGLDQLSQFLAGQLKTIRTRIKRAQRAETPEDVAAVHRNAEQEIHRKSKLLLTPKAPKERREASEASEQSEAAVQTTLPSSQSRSPRERQQLGGFAANCRFDTASMSESGPIYEAEQEGRTIIVRWNSDHPFYKRFVLDNQQDKGLLAAADYLVYSLACAELLATNDDNVDLIQNFKTTMSVNLRTLLS
jgi:anti-sigma regulatory factor (Ser/Thr protein kinase)